MVGAQYSAAKALPLTNLKFESSSLMFQLPRRHRRFPLNCNSPKSCISLTAAEKCWALILLASCSITWKKGVWLEPTLLGQKGCHNGCLFVTFSVVRLYKPETRLTDECVLAGDV